MRFQVEEMGSLVGLMILLEVEMTKHNIEASGKNINQTGPILEIAAATNGAHTIITAVRTEQEGNRLKLISWRSNPPDVIERLNDSGSLAGPASDIDMTRSKRFTDVFVVACRTAGMLKLIRWSVTTAGFIFRKGDSGNQGDSASKIKIISLSHELYLVACRNDEGNLRLSSWKLNEDDSFTRLHDSGGAAGPVSEMALSEIPIKGSGHQVVTAVRTNHRLKLIVWDVSPSGIIARKGDSGELGDEATMIRVVVDESSHIVTSYRDTNAGRLKLVTWKLSNDGDIVSRLFDSGEQAGSIGDNSLMKRPDGVLSAVQTAGNLKLISWKIDGLGIISRLGDSGLVAGKPSQITLCQEPLINNTVITALKMDGSVQLIKWKD